MAHLPLVESIFLYNCVLADWSKYGATLQKRSKNSRSTQIGFPEKSGTKRSRTRFKEHFYHMMFK